jgi:hypothetical protein
VRGIRIELKNEFWTDRVFIDEGELVYLKHDLDTMDRSVAAEPAEPGAVNRMTGIARCRPSQSVPQAFCPGYFSGADSSGLRLSTFAGHNFRFPAQRPSVLADAIGRAMEIFGLDNKIPRPPRIALPAEDLDKIVASAIRHFPQLESSPGIKAANYTNRETTRSAYAIFWPYKRMHGFAYSLFVSCEAADTEDREWTCNRSKPRGYLTIPGQESEIVITGDLGRERAIALINFAKLQLQDEPDFADMQNWKFSTIHPLGQSRDVYLVVWADSAYGAITYEIAWAPQYSGEVFKILRITRSAQ